MNNVITYTDYASYKFELDAELQRSAESFVRIGYLLKVARDTNILTGSSYASVTEFAEKEYGLDKSQVSRFININDRFSVDGYSEELKAEYKTFGYAKLALMLQLPTAINEELSPAYSKAEIQAVKEEYDEEKKISDIEVMLEGEKPEHIELDNISKAITQLGEDNPELYGKMFDAENLEDLKTIMAPDMEKIYSVRIQGVGRLMLSLKAEGSVSLINVRTNEKETCTWGRIYDEVKALYPDAENVAKAYEIKYGKAYPCVETEHKPEQSQKTDSNPVQSPKKEKVAPVQPKKKETKVQKAPVKTKNIEPKEEPVKEPETISETKQEDIPDNLTTKTAENVINTLGDSNFDEKTEEATEFESENSEKADKHLERSDFCEETENGIDIEAENANKADKHLEQGDLLDTVYEIEQKISSKDYKGALDTVIRLQRELTQIVSGE